MLRLQAFKIEQKEAGSAALQPGDTLALSPIKEFAAKPYTVEEEKSLSAIIKAFNERHGTQFTREDFIRFEQVNREIMDDDMIEMLRNNPPDVVFSAFSHAFFKGAIRLFQRDAEMKNIVLSDPQARDQAIRTSSVVPLGKPERMSPDGSSITFQDTLSHRRKPTGMRPFQLR